MCSRAEVAGSGLSSGCPCLSAGAWRHLTLQGCHCVLVPKLVTGCKIWHLRPDSCFYTKAAWQHATASIPVNSQVEAAATGMTLSTTVNADTRCAWCMSWLF